MYQFTLKKVTSLEKVFPDREPTGEGMEDCLTAMRGENVSFQIAYRWMERMKKSAKAEVISPVKSYLTLRKVELVPCEYPAHLKHDEDYITTVPGLYPDLLTAPGPWGFGLVSGQWRSIWVDIDVPKDAKAGRYPVEIRLTCEGSELGSASIVLEIMDAVMPKLHVPHTEWFHSDCLAQYYQVDVFSEEYWNIVENFIALAAKRHCNMILTPVFTPPLDTGIGGERLTVQLVDVEVTDGSYQFGYDKFERWVEMCRRNGIEYFEISHLFSQWGAVSAPKIMGTENGEYHKLFGWETKASGEAYAEFLHEFLASFKEELRKLGIEKTTYFHISDEPSKDQFETYQVAKAVVEKDLEGLEVIDALSDYTFYEKGAVKQPVCALDHMEPFIENRPEKLWGYYCTAQCKDVSNRFIAMPGQRERILGAMMYKFKLDGFLHWGYNFYNSEYSLYPIDPYRCTDSSGAFPSGDPFLVYPGKDGHPEESIRMMLMDEAMSDLCAMKYLEEKHGRDAVMECLETNEEEKIGFSEYPRSISYLINMRKRVNERIKDL